MLVVGSQRVKSLEEINKTKQKKIKKEKKKDQDLLKKEYYG